MDKSPTRPDDVATPIKWIYFLLSIPILGNLHAILKTNSTISLQMHRKWTLSQFFFIFPNYWPEIEEFPKINGKPLKGFETHFWRALNIQADLFEKMIVNVDSIRSGFKKHPFLVLKLSPEALSLPSSD